MEQPQGIIITIPPSTISKRGYTEWYKDFLLGMQEGYSYYIKKQPAPVKKPTYAYLIIDGQVAFRCMFKETKQKEVVEFSSGAIVEGDSWIVLCGPFAKPVVPIKMKGFASFRYCDKLF